MRVGAHESIAGGVANALEGVRRPAEVVGLRQHRKRGGPAVDHLRRERDRVVLSGALGRRAGRLDLRDHRRSTVRLRGIEGRLQIARIGVDALAAVAIAVMAIAAVARSRPRGLQYRPDRGREFLRVVVHY